MKGWAKKKKKRLASLMSSKDVFPITIFFCFIII